MRLQVFLLCISSAGGSVRGVAVELLGLFEKTLKVFLLDPQQHQCSAGLRAGHRLLTASPAQVLRAAGQEEAELEQDVQRRPPLACLNAADVCRVATREGQLALGEPKLFTPLAEPHADTVVAVQGREIAPQIFHEICH